jgi:hypothetical protein
VKNGTWRPRSFAKIVDSCHDCLMSGIREATDADAGEIWTVLRASFVTEHGGHGRDPIVGTARGLDSDAVRNVALYERHGYRRVPTDDILIHLTKKRETR